MLLNFNNKSPSSSFNKQLSYIKHRKESSPILTKNQQYFKVINSVLDLLLNNNPKLTSELLIIKKSLKKWNEHLSEEYNSKNKAMMTMKEDLILYVSKQIGIILEEIGYYIKHFVENYRDQDMKKLYCQYINSIQKLEWNSNAANKQKRMINQYIQTQYEQLQGNQKATSLKIMKNVDPKLNSEQTIDSPSNRYKKVDVQKYINIKQQNLELQRKMNQMLSRISELQNENKLLKNELDKYFLENHDFRISNQKFLNQINRLRQVLQNLKNEQQNRQKRQRQRKQNYEYAESKYEKYDEIKNELHETLNNVQYQLLNKQKDNQLNSTQRLNFNQSQNIYQTIKRSSINQKRSQDQYRMMFLQAMAIQSLLEINIHQK